MVLSGLVFSIGWSHEWVWVPLGSVLSDGLWGALYLLPYQVVGSHGVLDLHTI